MSKVKVSLRLCSHETCSGVVLPLSASRGASLETPLHPPLSRGLSVLVFAWHLPCSEGHGSPDQTFLRPGCICKDPLSA